MPTELYENLEAPKKAVLAAVDTGEYDVETSLVSCGSWPERPATRWWAPLPKSCKVLWRPPLWAAADCWS